MSKIFTLAGRDYSYRYGVRAFMAFEQVTGQSYTGATLSDQVIMMGCTLYDEDRNNPDLDRLEAALDERPALLREWTARFASDAEQWARAFAAGEEGAADDKKKE